MSSVLTSLYLSEYHIPPCQSTSDRNRLMTTFPRSVLEKTLTGGGGGGGEISLFLWSEICDFLILWDLEKTLIF